jgi:cyclopropane-fatty-acyl-phospholipid synthase
MERSAASAGGQVGISFAGAPYLDVAREAAALVFGPVRERRHAVRYWTDTVEPAGAAPLSRGAEPPFTLVLTSAGALRRMFLPPTELTLAEAFIHGDLDIEGDVEAASHLAWEIAERLRSPGRLARLVTLLFQLPRVAERASPSGDLRSGGARAADRLGGRRHSRARDAAAIRRHYDVGNDFYALWLDEERVYSCGYFPDGIDDIHAAQRAKLDLICRKLRLAAGERLLDIGCGWGGLTRHAVRHSEIRAPRTTRSPAQADYARDRAEAEGLAERCLVEVRDYRDLADERTFDKVVSVGMFEHVGRSRLATYFHAALQRTRPGGLFLNHGIVNLAEARAPDTGGRARRLWRRGTFIDRYVFPDGELVPLATALAAAEGAGFETRDVESLREHYVLTLRHWLRRLEASHAEAAHLAGERVYRIWRLYLGASAHAFDTGQIGVAQMLLARPDGAGRCRIPRTRQDVYAGTPA